MYQQLYVASTTEPDSVRHGMLCSQSKTMVAIGLCIEANSIQI